MQLKIVVGLFVLSLAFCAKSQSLNNAFNAYGDSAKTETNGEKSLKYSFKMLEISKTLNNDTLIASSYIEIAHDYRRLGNYTTALEYAIKAANFYESIQNDSEALANLGMVYNIIGTIYFQLNNYVKANTYFNKAYQIHLNYENKLLLFDDLANIGETCRVQGIVDSALLFFNQSKKILNNCKPDSMRLAMLNCNMGLTYMALDSIAKSDSLLKESFNYFLANDYLYPVCVSNYEIAKNALLDQKLEKAKAYAEKSLEMALQNNYVSELKDIYELLSEIAVKNEQPKQAYTFLKKHYDYRDSVVNNRVVSQMAEMRAEFEINKKQVEVDFLTSINKARKRLIGVLATGLFFILSLSLFLWKVNRKRKEANILLGEYNEELQQKNHIIYLALEEKEVLMKEIHHRVKNNLQIISSIISLQNMRITDEKIQNIFSEMQRRILAISSIHQKLYQSDSVSHINMKDYLTEVVDSIHIAFNNDNLSVSYEILVQNVQLNIDAAVSIGLIVNELATNAYKYAYKPNQYNHFMVGLSKINNGCQLTIKDNGPGIPDDINILESNSLGLRMVNLLSRQLNGSLSYTNKQGTEFTIVFAEMNLDEISE